MALELFGAALWLVFAAAGAWVLVTGRKSFLGLAMGIGDVRIRRLVGLFCVLVGAFFVFRISQGAFSPESVIGLYAGMGSAALVAWWKSRDVRGPER